MQTPAMQEMMMLLKPMQTSLLPGSVVSYLDLLQLSSVRSSAMLQVWSRKPSSSSRLHSSNLMVAPGSRSIPYILVQGEFPLLRHHSSQLDQLQIWSVGSALVRFLSIMVVVQRLGPCSQSLE